MGWREACFRILVGYSLAWCVPLVLFVGGVLALRFGRNELGVRLVQYARYTRNNAREMWLFVVTALAAALLAGHS